MPTWLISAFGFMGKRAVNFTIYAVIAVSLWGAYQKIFVSPTSSTHTTVSAGGKIVNVYSSAEEKVPMFGCAAWRIQNETYWKKPIVKPEGKK